MPFMQGVLTVKVVEASQLPLQNAGSVDPFGLVSRKALGVNSKIKAYVKIFLDDIHLRSTADWIHADHTNPKWNQSFTFFICQDVSNLIFKINDRNKTLTNLNTDSAVDQVSLSAHSLLSGHIQPDSWHPLSKRSGQLRLYLVFQDRNVLAKSPASTPPQRPPPPFQQQAYQSGPYPPPNVPSSAHPGPPGGYPGMTPPGGYYGPPGMVPLGAPYAPQPGMPSGPPAIGFQVALYPNLVGMEPTPLAPLPPRPPLGTPKQREVPSYFPATQGNLVTLYQDTDTPMLPCFNGVPYPDGSQYVPPCAWKDMYNAINNARDFVFVAGWSVWTSLSLIRDNEEWKKESHLGNLLKRKADEGCVVAVIVWDDQSSWDTPYIGDILEKGMMMTHDEATFKFFNEPGSRVKCLKQSREPKSDLSGGGGGGGGLLCTIGEGVNSIMGAINKEVAPRLLYTHHQKTVVVDDPTTKQMVAFVGGLDLTQGRFDSPEFPIFRTLRSFHKGDFRNKCYPGVTEESGPREPWHDIHSQVRGPAASQVAANFLERYWRCQEGRIVDDEVTRKISESFSRCNSAIPAPNAWHVQTFRSISTESAKFLNEERKSLLQTHKSELIDDGILRAYVHAIQNAEGFIYIENQYFLGSSYSWTKGVSERAPHVIPMEIVQKVISKIAAGQRFVVYSLIPMFPEGDPNGTAGQEILLYQWRTIDAMYRRVTAAIARYPPPNGESQRRLATDYLKFFCLAKQESPEEMNGVFEGEYAPKQPLQPLSNPLVLRRTLRHPIYVHSKMMIVDDDYIIVGSANINQRSMDGNRDSEIAIGAWQQGHQYSASGNGGASQLPRGEIASFRMALWAAHMGHFDPVFTDPATDACAKKVQENADAFWDIYRNDNLTDRTYEQHLLPYPYHIDPSTGAVSPLPTPFDCFLDTKASVVGANRSSMLPVMVKRKLIA